MTDSRLVAVLARSRRLGLLGSAAVDVQVAHAEGFAASIEGPPERFLDLGSGGGVPGLVLAVRWPESEAVLLDGRERRCAFLREAVRELGLGPRVSVVCTRAEEAARREDLRGRLDVVVARGFGPPPVTAECGAGFLRVGGRLVVSEPPGGVDEDQTDAGVRWDPSGLAMLGLAKGPLRGERFHYRLLEQVEPCPQRFPRRTGVPAKRPLF